MSGLAIRRIIVLRGGLYKTEEFPSTGAVSGRSPLACRPRVQMARGEIALSTVTATMSVEIALSIHHTSTPCALHTTFSYSPRC